MSAAGAFSPAGLFSPAGETAALSLFSAAIWGTSDFVGGLAAKRIRSSAVVGISHTLSLLVLTGLALATRSALPDRASAWYGLAGGIACGSGVILLYKALALGKMGATASISGVLAALLPVVFAFFTEGLPAPRQWVGFAVAAIAIWMVAAGPTVPGAKMNSQGLLLGVAAGASFGLLFILLKLAGRGGVLWPLACSRISSASLATGIAVLGRRAKVKGSAPEIEPPIAPGASAFPDENLAGSPNASLAKRLSWAVLGLAAIAGIFDASGNSFYIMATRIGRLDIAAVLSSLYPAATILLAALLLKERTSRTQAAGMVLALVAVALISA